MTKTELAKRISDQVEQNRERLIELCERLINVESVTGNEYDVQQEVIRIMSEIGMDIDAMKCARAPISRKRERAFSTARL